MWIAVMSESGSARYTCITRPLSEPNIWTLAPLPTRQHVTRTALLYSIQCLHRPPIRNNAVLPHWRGCSGLRITSCAHWLQDAPRSARPGRGFVSMGQFVWISFVKWQIKRKFVYYKCTRTLPWQYLYIHTNYRYKFNVFMILKMSKACKTQLLRKIIEV